jgi:hypothetical protein
LSRPLRGGPSATTTRRYDDNDVRKYFSGATAEISGTLSADGDAGPLGTHWAGVDRREDRIVHKQLAKGWLLVNDPILTPVTARSAAPPAVGSPSKRLIKLYVAVVVSSRQREAQS